MDSATASASPPISSPFSSPNTGVLLKRRITEWAQETGLPTSVCIHVDGILFDLHRSPLVSKCDYFKKELQESSDIELPGNFPGGSDTFEMVALFCYNSPLPLDPFNIAALRCAADFLQMTENYISGNLAEISDLYLNQVVLQNWDDTLIVLQKCQPLHPWSEELLIVSRCVESLAFMACMEILDPEQRRDWPVVTLEALAGRAWNYEVVKEITGQDLWIKDLLALPFEFFKRIIRSLRRQGMKEKYVSPIVVFYANKWVLSKKTHKFWETSAEENGGNDANSKVSRILEDILELLPQGDIAGRVIPVAFYFALLSRSLTLSLHHDSKKKLEDLVASVLYMARVEDFLTPENSTEPISSSKELNTMERIVVKCLSSASEEACSGGTPLNSRSVVAQLWDSYLACVANDPTIGAQRFKKLIEVIPAADRHTHDRLYRAISTFLLRHPHLSNEEKGSMCRHLNCQKLVKETCIQAVQNEQMPLRLIVQALFVQQLHTHQAFKDCSDSFRFLHCGEFSGSLPSSRCQLPKSQTLKESPCQRSVEDEVSLVASLGSLIQNDLAIQRSEIMKADYESTSFRIQALEQEVMSLKQTLQLPNTSKKSDHINKNSQNIGLSGLERRPVVKKRNPLGNLSNCMGSMTWAPQRKYASKLLKVLRKLAVLGKGKWQTRQGASSLSNVLETCRSNPLHEIYDC